eukprot:6661583-Pyramimonas_sp.AAC.1
MRPQGHSRDLSSEGLFEAPTWPLCKALKGLLKCHKASLKALDAFSKRPEGLPRKFLEASSKRPTGPPRKLLGASSKRPTVLSRKPGRPSKRPKALFERLWRPLKRFWRPLKECRDRSHAPIIVDAAGKLSEAGVKPLEADCM